MPLADGRGGDGPEDPAWRPLGLDFLLEGQRERKEWFTSREIVKMLRPVLHALQTLSEAKLVHRDVKPANILFFDGNARLGDISLLGEDAVTVTRRGTPGYATPSWYEGGHPDMFSVGATLYALLTGNAPDKMGRSSFLWPPQGEVSLSKTERKEWKRLHAVVRRATDERISERYVDFAAMLAVVEGNENRPSPGRKTTAFSEITPEQERHSLALLAANLEQGNFEVVVEFVEELFALHPGTMENPKLSLDRATALKELGRIEEAKEELRRPVHIHPNISWMPPRVALWEAMGEIGEAEASQTRILEAFGPSTMPLQFRAEIRAKRGDYAGVEADREAALPLNPESPNDQKRLVGLLWEELEDKYPGYRDYRTNLAGAGTTNRDPEATGEEAPDDQWVLAVSGVIADELAPKGTFWAGGANEAGKYLRSTLHRLFEEESYHTALTLVDHRTLAGSPDAPPPLPKTYILTLYRALLLKRLGRDEEAAREGETPLREALSPRRAAAALLDALGRTEEAEALLTGLLDALPSEQNQETLWSRLSLHALRAKVRAIRENHPGVRDDYEAARAVAAAAPPSPLNRSRAGRGRRSGGMGRARLAEPPGEIPRLRGLRKEPVRTTTLVRGGIEARSARRHLSDI
ncbi:MAG: hypothetical protein GXX91_06810 [Verrucomicrobiaceae bacterium]|nr:hypothetical protein [Verrucomicrobiaceae bacterium]